VPPEGGLPAVAPAPLAEFAEKVANNGDTVAEDEGRGNSETMSVCQLLQQLSSEQKKGVVLNLATGKVQPRRAKKAMKDARRAAKALLAAKAEPKDEDNGLYIGMQPWSAAWGPWGPRPWIPDNWATRGMWSYDNRHQQADDGRGHRRVFADNIPTKVKQRSRSRSPRGFKAARLHLGATLQYKSKSHSQWVDCVVEDVKPTGEVQMSCKPGYWMSLSEQAKRLRPRDVPKDVQVKKRDGSSSSSGSSSDGRRPPRKAASVPGARPSTKVKLFKMGEFCCTVVASYVRGHNAELQLKTDLQIDNRTKLEHCRSHMERQSELTTAFHFSAAGRSDCAAYDALCDYFVEKQRVGLVETPAYYVYIVPPNDKFLKELKMPSSNFIMGLQIPRTK